MRKRVLILAPLGLCLSGCIAKSAMSVVTAPVRAGSQAADWATTSQDESDRNRGRRDRKAEEKAYKEQRKRCREAGYSDC
jgi:hypothetical protein